MATATSQVNRQLSRESAQAENRRRRQRRRQGRRALRFSVLIAFLLVLGGILSITVFFKIENVVVIGSDKYAPAEIEAASGILRDTNMFRVNAAEVERNLLEQFPYIQSVEVRRKLPPKIEISITQETPEGAIRQGDQIALINRQGKVLEKGILLVPQEVPLIKGISLSGVQPGEVLGKEAQEKLVMLQYLLTAVEESDFDTITNVDLTDRLNIRIMYENRILLELGSEADLTYKLRFVKYILENKIPSDKQGTLDVAETYRNRAIFQENEGSEELIRQESSPEMEQDAEE